MSDDKTVAAALVAARLTGDAVRAQAPPDLETAYAAQARVAQALRWFDGAVPGHWKSGGPSREGLQTHAPLPPAGVWPSPANGRNAPGGQAWHLRGIEAEVALRLAADVTPERAATLDVAGARPLVDAISVAIEIVDSRWIEGVDAPALAKLADLQSHGALVLGAWAAFDPAHDWAAQRCSVQIGRATPRVFTGTHAMGDPAWVLPAWLRHATRDGTTVPAGTVVTTGTWCGLPMAGAGDAVVVAFDGIGDAHIRF